MQKYTDDDFLFIPTSEFFTQTEWLDFSPGANNPFPAGKLQFKTTYDIGYLITDSDTTVKGMRARPQTLSLTLYGPDRNNQICSFDTFDNGLAKLGIPREEIIPFYNCHGFTFADSKYWIDNEQVPMILTGDLYEPADKPSAQIVIFSKNNDIVHSAIFEPESMEFVGKTGVRGKIRTSSLNDAAQGNDFDDASFYRRRA